MKTAHDIVLKPVITENSMAGIADKKYTFKVATDATKVEIAQAVETLFPGAKVAKVNTVSVRGRFRRRKLPCGSWCSGCPDAGWPGSSPQQCGQPSHSG